MKLRATGKELKLILFLLRHCNCNRSSHHTYIHYITFHGSKVSQMTVGCGISHTITKTHIQYKWIIPYVHTHAYKYKSNTVNLHYVHKPLEDESILEPRNSSREKNECVFKYPFSANLNFAFSFITFVDVATCWSPLYKLTSSLVVSPSTAPQIRSHCITWLLLLCPPQQLHRVGATL
jgi:hypothetical protein